MARKIGQAATRKSSSPSPSPSPQPKPTPPNSRTANAPINKPAPQRTAGSTLQRTGSTTTDSSYFGGGGPDLGLYSGDMGGVGPDSLVTAPSEEDYLAGDSAYQAQLAALKGALERTMADTDLQRNNYLADYNSSLRDLGYTEGLNGAPGQWNWNDTLTASGKAYQNQLNDFASRGMIQSQGYADANSDLVRMLEQQYGQMLTNRNNFTGDLDRQLANSQAENTASQQAARAEAIARRAAQYGV